jgi:hypothetical protein
MDKITTTDENRARLRFPNIFRKKQKPTPQNNQVDLSKLATRDDFLALQKEMIEYKKKVILASLSPRQQARLQKILEAKKVRRHERG